MYPLYLVLLGEKEVNEISQAAAEDDRKEPKCDSSDSENEIPPEASDYIRATRKMMKVIRPRHKRLSRKFAKWLIEQGYNRIRIEKDQIDVSFRDAKTTYMTEIKIVYNVSTRQAIREAIGQVLEYNYYVGRKTADNWIILLDSKPSDDDIRYLRKVRKKHELPLNLGWPDASDFLFMYKF